jgi:hypothetical protein
MVSRVRGRSMLGDIGGSSTLLDRSRGGSLR